VSDPQALPQHHPVVMAQAVTRAENLQLRVADKITAFAGSMPFLYLHAAIFAVWMFVIDLDVRDRGGSLAEADLGRLP